MGSVKDLQVLQVPSLDKPGVGWFVFSDRYSVFDWGEMPDHIPDKGAALCLIGAWFLERFATEGYATHFRGLVENKRSLPLNQLAEPSSIMEVSMVNVPDVPVDTEGNYDYQVYASRPANILIPLEVIFRNRLPGGSSIFKRLESGQITLDQLGLHQMPQPGAKLPKPIIDVSTKLEITDRYMDWQEATQISGMNADERQELQQLTLHINDTITAATATLGLVHEDGKVEFAFDGDRNIMLVDVLGTPDECRFTMDGTAVSKEVARIWYRKTDWYTKVEAAKKAGRLNWKTLVETPPPLPPDLLNAIADLYRGFANELTGRTWFAAPSLATTVATLRVLLQD